MPQSHATAVNPFNQTQELSENMSPINLGVNIADIVELKWDTGHHGAEFVWSRCYEIHFSRWFYTERVILLRTLIQFFRLFSWGLERQPICSCWPPFNRSAVCRAGWRWVKCFYRSTDSRGSRGHGGFLAAIKITAGVLIHHPGHRHVALQYANVATPCPHCHLALPLSSFSLFPLLFLP